MKSAVFIALAPALFVLCLWGAFITGEWWNALVGWHDLDERTTTSPGVLIGILAFVVNVISAGMLLMFVHDSIGKKK